MRISKKTVDEIFRRVELVEIARSFLEIKRAGENDFKACCPFHNEKTPSFHINASKQVYHCFGCGAGGNVIDFVRNMVNTDYVGALRWLAQRYHIAVEEEAATAEEAGREAMQRRRREDGLRLLEETASWFSLNLSSPAGAAAREYLKKRGIDDETVRKFRIGYAPEGWDNLARWALQRGYSGDLLVETGLCIARDDSQRTLRDRFNNRLMFTICDELSRPIAFSGRVFGDKPYNGGKYVNSPESQFFHKSQVLYAYNFARSHFKQLGFALVCEGQLDVIACHRAGLEQAIASQGTAFTEDHARMLKRANVQCVHLAFDGDAAGHKATLRTIGILQKQGLQVMITTIPENDDPDSIFRLGGADALKRVMSVAEPAIPFAFRVSQTSHPEETPEANSAIVSDMLAVISTLQDPVAAAGHCRWLSQRLQLPADIIQDQLALFRRQAAEEEERQKKYERNAASFVMPSADSPGNGLEEGDSSLKSPDNALPSRGNPQAIMTQMVVESGRLNAVLELLLGLCLISEELTRRLIEQEALLAVIPDVPAKQALNLILAGTRDGEWAETVDMLPNTQYISDKTVSAAFASPLNEMKNCNYDIVFDDCIKKLNLVKLENEARALSEQVAGAQADEDEFSALNKMRDLMCKRQKLRTGQQVESVELKESPGGNKVNDVSLDRNTQSLDDARMEPLPTFEGCGETTPENASAAPVQEDNPPWEDLPPPSPPPDEAEVDF